MESEHIHQPPTDEPKPPVLLGKRTGIAPLGYIESDISMLTHYFDPSSLKGLTLSDLIAFKQRGGKTTELRVSEVPTLQQVVSRFNIPSSSHLPYFFAHDPVRITNVEVVETLRAKNILTLEKPILIPKTGTLPTEFENYAGAEIMLGSKLTIADVFPDYSVQRKVPTYNPTYVAYPANKDMLHDLTLYISAVPETYRNDLARLLADLTGMTHKYYFGNGTFLGQLGRHKAVLQVRDKMMSDLNKPGTRRHNLTFQEFKSIMDRYYPLPKVKIDDEPVALQEFSHMASWITKNKLGWYNVQVKSGAGILWGDKKRGEVVIQELELTKMMMARISEITLGGRNIDINSPDFDYLRLAKMKPKGEVYEIKEYETKTRNIFETNAFAFTPAQIVFRATSPSYNPNNVVCIGWSPFHGGMHDMMERIMTDKDFLRIFADNSWYTAPDKNGVMTYYSLDANKSEGTVRPIDAMHEFKRRLMCFSSIHKSWIEYGVNLYPYLACSSVAVVGNQQLNINYLSSGAVGTAQLNTVRMIHFYEYFSSLFKKDISRLEEACAYVGVYIKIERAIPLNEFKKDGTVIDVDFLGYGAAWLGFLGIEAWVGVLEYNRLLKALLFTKRPHEGKNIPPPAMNALKLVRYRAIYLAGGWYYPGVSTLIRLQAEKLIRMNIKMNYYSYNDYLLDIQDMLMDEAEGIDGFLESLATQSMAVAVPSLYEVVALCLDNIKAQDMVDFMLKDPDYSKVVFNFAPYEIIIERAQALGVLMPTPSGIVMSRVDERKPYYKILPFTVPLDQMVEAVIKALPEQWKDESMISYEDIRTHIAPPAPEKVKTGKPTLDILKGQMKFSKFLNLSATAKQELQPFIYNFVTNSVAPFRQELEKPAKVRVKADVTKAWNNLAMTMGVPVFFFKPYISISEQSVVTLPDPTDYESSELPELKTLLSKISTGVVRAYNEGKGTLPIIFRSFTLYVAELNNKLKRTKGREREELESLINEVSTYTTSFQGHWNRYLKRIADAKKEQQMQKEAEISKERAKYPTWADVEEYYGETHTKEADAVVYLSSLLGKLKILYPEGVTIPELEALFEKVPLPPKVTIKSMEEYLDDIIQESKPDNG